MVANLFANALLLGQLFAVLVAGHGGSSTPLYKNSKAPVDARVKDLLGRMTIEDKMAQLMQGALFLPLSVTVSKTEHFFLAGDITNWMNQDTGAFNYSGLEANMAEKAGMFYGMDQFQPGHVRGVYL